MADDKPQSRILLVDDEADFRLAASRVLTRQGFDVHEAESGERALEMIRESAPQLVVLDLLMEGMDGLSTLEEIRKFEPDLPVIILTGHGKFSDAMAGIQFQVVDFVQKPVNLKLLGRRIRAILEGDRSLPLRERSIEELIVPAEGFARIYLDQSTREVVEILREMSESKRFTGTDPRRGTLLVFDSADRFVGLIRLRDIVWMMVPHFLYDSPYSSYFTGMFLAQTKVMGQQPIEKLIRRRDVVDIGAPLMEAVHAMAKDRVGVVPIVQNGQLVGVLRDEDVFAEIALSLFGR